MRTLTTMLLAAAALPALAQTPGPDLSSAIPSYRQFQAEVRGMSAEEIKALADIRKDTSPSPPGSAISLLASKCYYIRQVNKNLQKPREKPELVPLAAADAEPLNVSDTDCLSDSIVRKPMR
jgi:hypothetical protein